MDQWIVFVLYKRVRWTWNEETLPYEVKKCTGLNGFNLWWLKILVQQGFLEALEGDSKFDKSMIEKEKIAS